MASLFARVSELCIGISCLLNPLPSFLLEHKQGIFIHVLCTGDLYLIIIYGQISSIYIIQILTDSM